MPSEKIKYIFQFVVGGFSFGVYIFTLAPSISYTDSGEIAMSMIKLAITHPTGYPILTMIGHIFSFIKTTEPVYILNIMCALLSSATVVVFFNLLVFLFRDFRYGEIKSKDPKKNKYYPVLNDVTLFFISASASLILAFSVTYWDSSNSLEVYPLHTLFLVILIYLILKIVNITSSSDVKLREKYWILFAYLLGLSFTNHLSTFFLLAGIIFIYIKSSGWNYLSYQRLKLMLIFFILGLSVYLYLPIKADNEIISWIFPNNLENIFNHIRGKHFQGLMFKSFSATVDIFLTYWKTLPAEFVYVPLLFSLIGLVYLSKLNRILFYFTLLIFSLNIVIASNYAITDVETYFLLSYILIALWSGFGILYVFRKFKLLDYRVAVFTLIIPAITLTINYSKTDESKNTVVTDYYFNSVNFVPKNSVIITEGMDVMMLASFYYQIVKHERTDVVVLNNNLLTSSVWYIQFLKKMYPEFYEQNQSVFANYQNALMQFHEKGEKNFDMRILFTAYRDLFSKIIETESNVFLTQEYRKEFLNSSILKDVVPGKVLVPYSLFWKFTSDTTFVDDNNPDFKIFLKDGAIYNLMDTYPFYGIIMSVYNDALLNRASYLLYYKHFNEAEQLCKKALTIFPNDNRTKQLLTQIDQLRLKR